MSTPPVVVEQQLNQRWLTMTDHELDMLADEELDKKIEQEEYEANNDWES